MKESYFQYYPPPVNLSEIYMQTFGDPWKKHYLPFFNSKSYLNQLIKHVATTSPQVVRVIVGPKDAGKSTGIEKLIGIWKKLGHIIVDINLKGLPHDISGKEVMGIASGALKDLINFDTNTYGNI